jgi:glycosyltransferase involved in cell wall biosynthesis
MTELSVVLISKNQAWSICRLIESVLREVSGVSSKEIILVDSASTDETIALAKRYPVTILRLRAGQRLSPAIGRFVGYKHARGDYILFLDGDTELIPGWLPHAFRLMRDTPGAAAVTGHVINLPTSEAGRDLPPPVQRAPMAPPSEVLWCNYGGGGVALYRRSVLEKVGTFNPYLNSEEEPELGLRIRHAGFRILEIDHPVARHYNDAPVALTTPLSRRRRKFHLGVGQAARCHLGTPLFWHWIKERWWDPAATLLLTAGVASFLVSLVVHSFIWFGLWIFALCLLIVCLALRKRSLRAALVAAFNWLFMAEGFLRGSLTLPLLPAKFHAEVETVQSACAERHLSLVP